MHVPDNRLSPAARMSPAKRALLEMHLRGQVPVRTETQAISRRPRGGRPALLCAEGTKGRLKGPKGPGSNISWTPCLALLAGAAL